MDSAKYFYFNADVESLDIAGYTKLQEMRQKGYYENPRFSDSNIQILTLELAGERIELDFSPYFSQLEIEELKPSFHKPFEFVDGDRKYVLTFASWKKEEDGKVIFDSFGGYVLKK